MGDKGEDKLELAEAEKDFIAYLEKTKEKEIRVWQTFSFSNNLTLQSHRQFWMEGLSSHQFTSTVKIC